MGFNFGACGYETAEAFVAAHFESEGHHLQAFIDFLQSQRLDRALRKKDWAAFAMGYNGPSYKENRYDERLSKAYRRVAARGG